MNHFSALDAPGGDFPQFFHAHRIRLRVADFSEAEPSDHLLGERAARPFREDGDFGVQVVARLKISLVPAVAVHALVLSAHACHARAVVEHFHARKAGE